MYFKYVLLFTCQLYFNKVVLKRDFKAALFNSAFGAMPDIQVLH